MSTRLEPTTRSHGGCSFFNAITLAVASVIAASCSAVAPADESGFVPPPTPGPLTVLVYLDGNRGTRRINPTLPEEAGATVLEILGTMAGADLRPTGAADPLGAIDVKMFEVAANTYATGDNLLADATLPAAAALRPKPTIEEFPQSLAEAMGEWNPEARQRMAAIDDRRAAIEELRSELGAAQIGGSVGSDPVGATSAAAQMKGPGRTKVILVSDLTPQGDSQMTGDLSGLEFLLVQACDDAADCDQAAAFWTNALTARGAESVQVVRPDVLPSALIDFLEVST